MIRRLRAKFICITMAVLAVMLCVIFGLVYHFTRESLEDASISALKAAAAAPAQLPMPPGNGELPCFSLQMNKHGTLTVSGHAFYDLTDQELLQDIYRQATRAKRQTGILKGYFLRYYRCPDGRCLFTDISRQQHTLEDLIQSFLWIGIVGIAGFLALSVFLANWAVKPVETAWKQQRQFVADASHELKTPLTVIMTNGELLTEDAYSDEEKAVFSRNILSMSRRMRTLVENLLELARADNESAAMEQVTLELSRLVEEAVLPMEPAFFEKGLTLESRIQEGLQVNGSASHLQQVVQILLDNALKYSTPGGSVELTLQRHSRGKLLLTVTTPGQPLSEAQCRDIFKRFYRVDQARTGDGSYGLGLPIAQELLRQHGGRIWAKGGDGCNMFYVNLPEV